MKKNILLAIVLIITVAGLVSCGASKKGTGCPMTENIIH
jgi:hypothetical protein